jgi:hypothetical protein
MSRPASRVVVVLAAATALAGACGGPPPRASTAADPAPIMPEPQPVFDLALVGPVSLPTYTSDPAASLNECAPASSGGWTFMYAGGTPFLTLDLSIYAAAVAGADRDDFDLDIVASGRAVRLVPSGRREGAQGDGVVRVEARPDGGVTIALDGTAVTLEGGPASVGDTAVHLDLDCPAEE